MRTQNTKMNLSNPKESEPGQANSVQRSFVVHTDPVIASQSSHHGLWWQHSSLKRSCAQRTSLRRSCARSANPGGVGTNVKSQGQDSK